MENPTKFKETDLTDDDIEYLIRLVYRDLNSTYKYNNNTNMEKNIKDICIKKRVLDKLSILTFKNKNYRDYND